MSNPNDALPLARCGLIPYTIAFRPDYRAADLHYRIAGALERIAQGKCKRLMIFVPPRHGKSMLTSEHFPPWYLGLNPSSSIVCATYAQELADDFGRKVRNQMVDPLYASIFPECKVSADSASVSRIATEQHGNYYAVGIGGALTGRGANVLVVDDPHKDRADADSFLMRKRAKDWFQSVAYTRLMPGGAIVVMQCMTGETLVLMTDGTQKRLDGIHPGDEIMSYKGGAVVRAVVTNWAQQSRPDNVFSIRMKSGIIVKANARHPFLVSIDGEAEWLRTDTLKPGHLIHRVITVSGAELNAPPKVVSWARKVADYVIRTIASKGGPLVLDLLRPSLNTGVRRISDIVMGLGSQITSACLWRRAVCVPYAANRRTSRATTGGYASIIVTTQAMFAGFFAITATSSSVTGRKASFAQQPTTFKIVLDEVVEIASAGTEHVYDIEVAATGNFIANGLVASNTRWHEDDLAGWLLREHGSEGWETLEIPAEPAPWPEHFPAADLARTRAMIGVREWSALYMQQPVPGGGGEIRKDWVHYYHSTPDEVGGGGNKYILCDPAGEQRPENDYTSIWVLSLGADGNYYWIDGIRDRLNITQRTKEVMRLHRKWKPIGVRYERYGMMGDIQALRDLQERENYRFEVTEVAGTKVKKNDRIRRLIPMFEQGKFYAPVSLHYTDTAGIPRDLVHIFVEEEMAAFPAGLHDDMLDSLARIAEPELPLIWPSQEQPEGKRERYSSERLERASAWAA